VKLTITSFETEDYGAREKLEIDGKRVLCVRPLCECPEDAIIGRDLVSCYDVLSLMRRAHAAGLKGEEFDVTEKTEEF
jgi:hypothetical protein